MIVVSCAIGEGVTVVTPDSGKVVVTVRRIDGGQSVHLEIDAPNTVPIHRREVYEAIRRSQGADGFDR